MNKSKVTIYDVADRLGVSTATVNRVLNNKPNVSEKTRGIVLEAIKEMGYRPSRAASSLSRTPVHITMIISSTNVFMDEFRLGAEKAFDELSDFGLQYDFMLVDSTYSSEPFFRAMYECAERGTDAILLIPPTDEDGLCSTISELSKKGVKFGIGVHNLASKDSYVNIARDGVAAGAMAAEMLMCMLKPGDKVAMLTGNRKISVHSSTIEGFLGFIAKSELENAAIYEHNDDPALGVKAADRLIREHPDVKGVYIGTATSVSFCRRLEELGYGRKIRIVASDIFEELAQLMDEGLVQASIFQEPYRIGKLLVRFMYEHIAEGKKLENRNILLNPQIILNSNKDLYLHGMRSLYGTSADTPV